MQRRQNEIISSPSLGPVARFVETTCEFDERCANYYEELAPETAVLNFCVDDRNINDPLLFVPDNTWKEENEKRVRNSENDEHFQLRSIFENVRKTKGKRSASFKPPSAEGFSNIRNEKPSLRSSENENNKPSQKRGISRETISKNESVGFYRAHPQNRRTKHASACDCELCEATNDIYYEYLDEGEIHECETLFSVSQDDREIKNNDAQNINPHRRRMNADSGKSPLRYADTPTSAQTRSVRINDDSSLIDYSSRSFREAKEAINTAARAAAARNLGDLSRSDGKTKQIASAERNYTTNNAHDSYRTHDNYSNDSMQKYGHENGANSKRNQNAPSADNNAKKSGMRVRRVGNTTIVTHHRDPYSFYWQLDQVQRREKSPPRPRFQQAATTIVDEVSELEEDEAILDDDDAEERPNPVEKTILSPDSNDSGVNMENYYSKPYKEPLPNGWEKHKDPSGYSYYWHVDSGVIQREPPPVVRPNTPRTQSPPAQHHAQSATALHSTKPTSPPPPPQPLIMEEHAFRQITTKRRVENNRRDCDADDLSHDDQFYIEFTVRSLGGAELAEEDLRDAECSINAAIASLSRAYSYGNASAPPPPLQYANGAELLLKLDDKMLTLQDARTNDVLDSARVHNIRIWGVAKENPHEFAYVTRDPRTRRFFCHAFRCESAPAIDVANALRDLCTRIVHTHQNNNNNEDGARSHRPTSLGFGRAYGSMTRDNDTTIKRITRESLLLTPIEEPQRLIRCFFIGITQVPKATGIDTLNEAVDRLVREVGVDRWLLADVSVAPSAIRIHEASPTAPLSGTLTRTRPPIAECRVRFLSFLGIGRDIKHCAFIMHSTGADSFLCYVFRVEPNAALMAKTIEGACKLRYQKVLDAYLSRAEHAPIHAITGAPITTTTTYSC